MDHSWLRRHGGAICLTLIVIVASLRALQWVSLVPIYQSPDEPAHLDYAFWLAHHGDLLHLQRDGAIPPPAVYNGAYVVHPYSRYLLERTRAKEVWFHAERKVTPNYGTQTYFQELDRDAPADASSPRDRLPGILPLYPVGYYALLASWLRFLEWCGAGIVGLFFGARILSVLLLAVSLPLTYATARELRFSQATGLVLTACVGMFPLTSFIASYVQPDNLTLMLVSLCFYLTLVARRKRCSAGALALLGLALAALFLTKLHTFVCVAAPAFACLLAVLWGLRRPERHWFRATALLLIPLAVAAFLQRGISQETTSKVVMADVNVLRGVQRALFDFYHLTTFRSFWGIYGWMDTPLCILSPEVSYVVKVMLKGVTWLVLVLGLTSAWKVTRLLIRVVRHGRPGVAAGLFLANVPLNSFFLFTLMMIAVHALTHNFFNAQGRNWFPMLTPMFMLGLVQAPKALAPGPGRKRLAFALAAGLVCYCLIAGHYALTTVEQRYYDADAPTAARTTTALPGEP
jgi:dolichyl-phosphate-mannose-protein mannosyltransferase